MAISSMYDMLSALVAQRSLSKSASALQANAARMASGSRLDRAATDIAALSIATALASGNTSLRAALQNTAQGSSLLQVADGGMQQIGEIMQRMTALATQANSGALSESGRRGLNQEFQALRQEIDRLSGNTNFNGVNLIDGSIAGAGNITTNESTATRAQGAISFAANVSAGDTIVINGRTLTAGTDFTVGASAQETVQNLANTLNASTDARTSQATYTATGGTLRIEALRAGEAGNQFTIDQANSTAAFSVAGDDLGGNGVFSLEGGVEDGVSGNSTRATGNVTDSLVTGLSQRPASSSFRFDDASDIQDGDTIQIDDGEGGLTTFTFRNNASGANDIQIGGTLEDTLENAAATLDSYEGADDFGIRQLDFRVSGNSLEVVSQSPGNANDVSGNALDLAIGTTGGTLTNASLNNGSNGGIDASGVSNADFVGNIQGFEATYRGADQVEVSVRVGSETYTAQIQDTTPGADTKVRFTSENGGFFDVELAAGKGSSVSNQQGADTFANRLNAAFSGVEFTQNRQVESYNPTGSLTGSSFEFRTSDFSDARVGDIRVQAAFPGANSNASIEVEINGETYRSVSGLGRSLGAGESIELRSLENPDRSLTFRNGNNAVDLSSNISAQSFRSGLEKAFGGGNGGLNFQVGTTAEDSVPIRIGDARSQALLGNGSLDLLSQGGASLALSSLSSGMDMLTSLRADVGAQQSLFDFTAANIATALENQEAARASLADTDIASESSQRALNLIQQQSSLALLAQTNKLSGGILKLLGGN